MTFGLPWPTWEPMYRVIIEDMGYDRENDERARDELADLCPPPVLGDSELPPVRGRQVGIAGGAQSLETELDRMRDADVVFAASTATSALDRRNVDVAIHVTDLDKDEGTTVARTRNGRPVALHAHGDNRDILACHVPRMDTRFVLPTTQAEPNGSVRNPGGFTDGDRAAFLAHALGADELVFAGWDFDDPTVDREKRRKLQWAQRLLYWLEQRRGERFSVLDGDRNDIDITSLPDPTT